MTKSNPKGKKLPKNFGKMKGEKAELKSRNEEELLDYLHNLFPVPEHFNFQLLPSDQQQRIIGHGEVMNELIKYIETYKIKEKYIRFGDTIIISVPRICSEVIVNREKENYKISLPKYQFSLPSIIK